MASGHDTPGGVAPHYSWKMLSSAHVKKRKKLKGIQNKLGQMFSLEAYDFLSSDSDVSPAASSSESPSVEAKSNLESSGPVAKTEEVDVPAVKRRRIRSSGTSNGKEPSPQRIKAYNRLTGSTRHKSPGQPAQNGAERKRIRPSSRVSGSEVEGSVDCVPETSQEFVPTSQPSPRVPLSGEGVDGEQEVAVTPISEASGRTKRSAKDGPGARVKKKKKRKRSNARNGGFKVSQKKKKRRRKEQMQEGDTPEGSTESSVASRLVNSKEPGAMVQLAVTHDSLGQVAEEEGKRGEDEEDEEKEEEKEEEDWEEDWEDKAVQHVGLPPAQDVSSAQLERKRRSPSDGVPANSRRRLFLPDLSECEDSDSEEDQYQHLHQSWNLTQEDEIKLGPWCKGAWTKQEAKVLHRNVKRYVEENRIEDLQEFLFERKRKQHLDFFKRIAKDINRPLFAVYRKACRLYDTNNYLGPFTEDEDLELKRLHVLHGNMWKLIGERMERSADAVRRRYLHLKRKERTGQWMEEEEERLTRSVLSAFKESAKTQLTDDHHVDMPPCDVALPGTKTWELVSSEVGTRNAQQCRHKWYYHLCWKTSGEMWTVGDSLRLVNEVMALDVDSEGHINWQALADGWPEARSGYYLRRKWAALRRFVPNYEVKDLPEVLDYLYSEKVPVWQKKLERGVKGGRRSIYKTPRFVKDSGDS